MTRIVFTAACLIVTSTFTVGTWAAQGDSRKTYAFNGVVERIDAAAETIAVRGDEVKGWMGAMTMIYRVDRPAVLTTLSPGDLITATVYQGDFTTLYSIREVVPTDGKRSKRDPTPALPPIVYACLATGEGMTIRDTPGNCPASGAPLVPVRLTIAYSCLKVTLFTREDPGRCPVDGTPMVPVTVSVYFTCKADPAVRDLSPGRCADGAPREKAFDRVPHGDHNPRHGGSLFMASNQWHHLEGTFHAPNIFRVYFYDDLTRPFIPTGITASVVKTDDLGKTTGGPIRLTGRQGGDRTALEASIPGSSVPLRVQLRVKFSPKEKDEVFDFTFGEYSQEP